MSSYAPLSSSGETVSSRASLSSRGVTAGSSVETTFLDTAVKPRYDSWARDDNGARDDDRVKGSRLCGKNSMLGFTLLEVMIALLVITLGIGAVINTTSESGWKSSQLKQKTIASWVAQNQIAEYRARRTWNNASSKSGQVEMANTVWIWQMKVSATDDPSLRRIDVDVLLKGEDGIKASLTGFIAKL